MDQTINIFISYAHQDEEMKKELINHIIKHVEGIVIIEWKGKNNPEENIDSLTLRVIKQADIILLLISNQLLSNTYFRKIVLPIALKRHSTEEKTVIPVLLEYCDWKKTSIAKLQMLPEKGLPIISFKSRSTAYNQIARAITKIISTIRGKPKWLQMIEEEMAGRTGHLYLSNNGLIKIPDELNELHWLKTLDLSNNAISKIEGLGNLEGLKNLFLGNNRIDKIEGLGNLNKLEELNLAGNQITRIEGLYNQAELKNLILNSNQISKIEGLNNLKSLKILDLNLNAISRIEGLDNLGELITLSLGSNKISKIEGLGGLKKLQDLYLGNNKIARIEGLDELEGLMSLHLSSNQITRISGLGNLKKLKTLFLDGNQITRIGGLDKLGELMGLVLNSNQIIKISGLDNLGKLKTLFLDGNRINRIEGLDKLIELETLSLSSNQIKIIDEIQSLPLSLKELHLFNNPIENIDITIFGSFERHNCINDLKNIFAEEVQINVPEVKLVLTGNSDVGKTKFRDYFTKGVYDKTRNSTHGLEVHPYEPEKKIKKQYGFEEDTKIIIWDFGGQEYFHNTHQLFFNRNAVYIFLWEKATNKNAPFLTEVKKDSYGNSIERVLEHFDADYWLSNIRHFAKDATIILVQNKVDIYDQNEEPLEWLPQSSLKQFGCKNQFHISISESAKKNLYYWYDFEKLKHTIFNELKSFVSKNKEGNIYNQVRKEIEKLKSGNDNYWKAEDFNAFIEDLKAKSPSAKANTIDNRLVIEHFHRQGKVLYPSGQPLENGKVIFTNPQWLSEMIYRILNDEVLQRNGFFTKKDLEDLAAVFKFENDQVLGQIIELMKEYNIVFFNPNKDQYVAPQYLPEVPTVHYSQVKKLLATPKLIIKVEGFLPKSVINNIIAKYAIKDEAASFYKYGVKTEEKNWGILLIEVNYPENKIYVYTNANKPKFIREVFAEILFEFGIKLTDTSETPDEKQETGTPSLISQTEIISSYTNKIYISIDDKIFVDWIELWNSYRVSGKNQERDYFMAEDGNMVLRKMFSPYYLPFKEVKNSEASEQAKPNKLFISYSSKNTDFMKRLVTHLEPLKRNGTIELWYDRMIEPGTKWDDSIKEEMRKADLIIFLLSPDFIATNYIFENEIPQAIKQMESENSKLFFIELQSCSWHRTVLSRFQQTTDPNADNKGVMIIGEAMNDAKWKEVVNELEKKIAKK